MNTVTVERWKLYQQVWSVPGQTLARRYGISDVGLAKACKRYDIPRPPRGYWARIAAGQSVRKPPLPNPHLRNELVQFQGWDITDEDARKRAEEQRMSRAISTTPLPAELHPLVAATRDQLLAAKPDHEGMVQAVPPALNVRLSPPAMERAVGMLDALVKRWELRGGKVETVKTAQPKESTTRFALGPDSLGLQVVENVDESKPLTDPNRLRGTLTLYVTGEERKQFRRRWSETKSQRMERMLGPLVETLANALIIMCQERLDAECVARQKQRIRALREAASQSTSLEFYRQQNLMQSVNRWHEAQRIRAYLAAFKTAVDAGKWVPKDEQLFADWWAWAERFADSMDPTILDLSPEGKAPAPQNTAIAELDLTTTTKTAMAHLGVPDTDALWKQSREAVTTAAQGEFGRVWNEITRVLEVLGYDVSKRERAYE